MTDSWKSPKYAPNSDIEPDLKEDSDSSDYETPIEPQVKAASDPWNDPEDDDEEEEDDSFMRNNTSPDYLSSTKTNDNGQLKGNGAWDALHSEDEDTEEDDIPAGLTVRGREIKDLSRNQSTGPNVTANGEATDMGHIDHESSEEPQRKRQRTDNADELMPEQAVANTNQRSESENNRAVPHNIPPRPSYPALNPTSGSHAPPKGHMSSTQAMGRVHPSRQAPHHPTPGLIMSSFFGITPRDEFVRIIGEWLLKVCHGLAGVEIEFKFGTLVDRNTKKRISLPCLSETILPENFDCLFLSEMTEVNASSVKARTWTDADSPRSDNMQR
ncbi:hypothetical protein QFC19_001220 [Naganishia cerealis]|uniref:Uncharacterized protein n=1 Tax=Naganishia cerealis TaxID=610337 RepID=A0ACC2WK27_9TREE|nr:hypothetical protein QFC19_001220 [Naganishia cerealis]